MTVSVMLFTRDLRLTDNPALTAAARGGTVVPLFAWDPQILAAAGGNASRLGFLLDSLQDLDAGIAVACHPGITAVEPAACRCGSPAEDGQAAAPRLSSVPRNPVIAAAICGAARQGR